MQFSLSRVLPMESSPLNKMSKTEKDKRRRDKQRRAELGILVVGYLPQEQFPRHLRKTFQQIRRFKDYSFAAYCDLPPSNSGQSTWRNNTRLQAKRIAEMARVTLLEGKVSEMEWRLRLEEPVLTRFRYEIDW
jgi:hypothetical protein